MAYFQRLIINSLTFLALAVVFQGNIYVRSFWAAIIAAFVLSLLNMLVKPILTLLSLPLTFLTLGLFSFVVNGLILSLTSQLVGQNNFGFSSFWWAIVASAVMSFVNMIISEHRLNKMNE
ncbi:phage holin family protein [Enterococcus timonensis]|uniref:phage holin family protein n=1 Tax=Enterococcus timonensis TaxID=1852364 RepID=UPI0008D9F0F0|nr:phage holin family protein [Enterococcus timonensis]